MTYDTLPDPITLQEIEWQQQEEKLCTVSRISEWLECASTERQQSAYFGPISTQEAFEMMFNKEATQEQVYAASRTIRKRFLTEHSEEVARMVMENQEYAA